jgi:hypothetical protein
VAELEVLVGELVAVDGLATGTVVVLRNRVSINTNIATLVRVADTHW